MLNKHFPIQQALFSIFIFLYISPTKASFLTSIEGTWEGKGRQDNNTSWTIKITINKNGEYSIAYPSLTCGGELILLEEHTESATFRENINYGNNRCIDNGKVKLEKTTFGLNYFWYYPNGRAGAKGSVYLNTNADQNEQQTTHAKSESDRISYLMPTTNNPSNLIVFGKASGAPLAYPNEMIKAPPGGKIEAVDSISELGSDEILMRVKLGEDDYLLYKGKINLAGINEKKYYHLDYRSEINLEKLINIKLFKNNRNFFEELNVLYFDKTGICTIDEIDVYYLESDNKIKCNK